MKQTCQAHKNLKHQADWHPRCRHLWMLLKAQSSTNRPRV